MYTVYLDNREESGSFSFKFETIEESAKLMSMLFEHYDDYESDYALIFTIVKN